jgi:hypothetical protein
VVYDCFTHIIVIYFVNMGILLTKID